MTAEELLKRCAVGERNLAGSDMEVDKVLGHISRIAADLIL
jgi:hypothetical protein